MNESDLEFENQLKRELRPVDAPEGFADRVMQRVEQQPRGRLIAMPNRRWWVSIAAILLVALAIGGWQQREKQLRENRPEAQQAAQMRHQFDVAMQVTGRTLTGVQERIGRAGEVHGVERKREVEQ